MRKGIAVQYRTHGVTARAQSHDVVITVAVRVSDAGARSEYAHALQWIAVLQNAAADAKGCRRADTHNQIITRLPAAHVRNGATHHVFAGTPTFTDHHAVRTESAVAKIPMIGQHVAVRIARRGRESHESARGGICRRGGNR